MEDDGNAGDAWVPPNDRQLALRAKLHYGWSSAKSKRIDNNASKCWSQPTGASEPLTREEQEKVVQVIRRAEEVSGNEQLRVSKLVDRVRNIQKNAVGSDGTNQCVLCGDYASVFLSWSLTSARHVTCKDCLKCAKNARWIHPFIRGNPLTSASCARNDAKHGRNPALGSTKSLDPFFF
ncbi:rab effector Noc2 isoform X1 [Daphnia magna]|nr:rab effector Noc2 isoform X1 [Daphnia magna]XP_045023371.1 rab effector Noc2 isoform X1 [Daphnia magna]